MTIVCFGKNYQDHMNELGDKPVDRPVIFLKPESVLKTCKTWGETMPLVLTEDETHFECELVFKLKSGGFQLTRDAARTAIDAVTIGLDMTKRVLQKQLKEAGHPWTIGKAFPDAAVIGPWISVDDLDYILSQPFSFSLNDVVQQKSAGQNMLFSPVDLIMYASNYFPLSAGDMIFTGTPSGVGAVHAGDSGELRLGEYAYSVVW